MRVQLRIKRPRHPMPVGGRDEAAGALELSPGLAAANEHRLVLEVLQRCAGCRLVRSDQLSGGGLVGDREQHADRLRCRERQVERSDSRVAQRIAQPPPRIPRIVPGQQCGQLRSAHPTVEPERRGAAADPLARRLAATGVVIITALSNGALVVALLALHELADAQHRVGLSPGRVILRARRGR